MISDIYSCVFKTGGYKDFFEIIKPRSIYQNLGLVQLLIIYTNRGYQLSNISKSPWSLR